jgi:septum formation protein
MSERLILASGSPRRRELLERVGFALDVRPADIDETERPGEDPAAYVARLARAKVDAVPRAPGAWALAADTTVTIDGAILGKADSDDDARRMLGALSGRTHRVTTAFCLSGPDAGRESAVTTEVTFRVVSPAEIDDYVRAGEWRGKAGAYAVQGMASAMVAGVRGSITNVIGLPLAEVLEALSELGAARVDYPGGVSA